ncbi:MAG: TetR family transcriptional regulator [Thermoleophilia bacterium]
MSEGAAPRRRGPRPAGADARGAIVAAARTEFAARGYDGVTLRGIARAAGVDARLVHHYFSGKEELFVAAMELPVQPQDLVPAVFTGDPDGLGERLVRFFFSTWDAPDRRPVIVGLLRAALSGEDAAGMLRQFLARALFGRIAEALDADDPELRANLAAAQLGGVALLRYVLEVEPLASAEVEELVPMLAPVIQHHLTAPLP